MKKNSLRTILAVVFVALCALNLVACGFGSSTDSAANGTYYFYDLDHDDVDEAVRIVIKNGKATVYGLIAENMTVKIKNKSITLTTTNRAENTKHVLSGKILSDGAIYFDSTAEYFGSLLVDEDSEDLWFCKRDKTPYDFDEFNQSGGGGKDDDNDNSGTTTDTGYNVGDIAPDFTLSTYNYGRKFNLYKNRDNITVINFWATWCTPCVNEMPLFIELAERYPQITVVAVHGSSVSDVQDFIDKNDWTISPVIFAQDDVDGTSCITYRAFGGTNIWPLTVIVGADGKVLYRVNQSFEAYEQLEKLVISFIDNNDNDN